MVTASGSTSTRSEMNPYHFSVTVHEPFELAVNRTREALSDHGFGIVTEMDIAAILHEKLGIDRDPYLILGACNPGFANQAVESEPSIGVLLPCNVVIRADKGDAVVIDFMDPAVMVDLAGNEQIHKLADEVRTRLEMTRVALATG